MGWNWFGNVKPLLYIWHPYIDVQVPVTEINFSHYKSEKRLNLPVHISGHQQLLWL